MDNFFKDVRHGLRLLARNPVHSVIAILALTAGIGLTTTMFSIVYGALYRGLPFDQPHRIIHLERSNLPRGETSLEVPIHDYRDWRAQQRSFEQLGAFYGATVNLSGTERPVRLEGAYLTANSFSVLRVRPHLGRLFRDDDELSGTEQIVLLGYNEWETRFNADPAIVGKSIRINGEPATIVGVMPDQFMFPDRQQIWLPLRIDPLKTARGAGRTLEVFGRLRAGVSIEDARADLAAIAQRLEQAWPASNRDIRPVLKPFTEEYIGPEPRTLLFTMLGAVFFVLLIACTNVANLLLGRAILRNKEVGIRTALGASRWLLVTQFLTEALVLSTVGALLGLGIAWIGIRLFNNAILISE
ncbi:MAG: ABC transporter permease, partial [Longimicrobiales bacterium]